MQQACTQHKRTRGGPLDTMLSSVRNQITTHGVRQRQRAACCDINTQSPALPACVHANPHPQPPTPTPRNALPPLPPHTHLHRPLVCCQRIQRHGPSARQSCGQGLGSKTLVHHRHVSRRHRRFRDRRRRLSRIQPTQRLALRQLCRISS
jgi:hypothetical protein